jgi:hypothetical protein
MSSGVDTVAAGLLPPDGFLARIERLLGLRLDPQKSGGRFKRTRK